MPNTLSDYLKIMILFSLLGLSAYTTGKLTSVVIRLIDDMRSKT